MNELDLTKIQLYTNKMQKEMEDDKQKNALLTATVEDDEME